MQEHPIDDETPSSPAAAVREHRRRLSTAQHLSFLTVGVVVAVLLTAMAVVWLTLTRSAVEVAQDRVNRSVAELVNSTLASLRQAEMRYGVVAYSEPVTSALHDSTPSKRALAAAQAALSRLQLPTDSGLPTELWDASGRRVTFVGDDVSEPLALSLPGELGHAHNGVRPGLDSLRHGSAIQLGSLYRVGTRTFFWLVLPIREGDRVLGYLAQKRRIATNPQTERTVRELVGNSATGYYHNSDGSMWTTFGGQPALPPKLSAMKGLRVRDTLGAVIHAERKVVGTPLTMVMEIPRDEVLARPKLVVRRLALFSMALTLLAVFAAWLAGRRVARPLVKLTGAAEAIARGDYSTRVPRAGSREIARLATSFNRMASEVGTSRAMLESREAELRTLANTIPQLAWMADTSGNAFWLNERWYAYTGDMEGAAPQELLMAAHEPAMLPDVRRRWETSLRTGTPFEMEVRLRGADGSYRWFLTRAAAVRDQNGHVTRWFGTSTDIQALREARDAAEAGNRAKSDFLAAMSHELRTPLNAIGGYVELLEMGLRGPISDAQRRDLERIRASQAHLLGLISTVLDLTRIESGRVKYELRSIRLQPVLESLEELILPQATAKKQVLQLIPGERDLAACADLEKLRQILLNLLSNAVRYSPDEASISISAERVDGDRIAIHVRDTGPGIPLDRRESIFEPFVQLDRTLTSNTEGVGLGLAISRDLARGMGGELAVTGAPDAGACFTLTLPADTVDADPKRTRTSEMPALRLL